MAKPNPEMRYMDALDVMRQRVDSLHELMHDPFKVPELSIFAIHDVQAAMWEAQVEYAAMMRAGERRRAGT